MLLEILAGQASGFANTNEMLPDVGKHEGGAPVLPGSGRLIKTHEPFRTEYKKAIYLVRDPRDVALSEFAYQKALGLSQDDFDAVPRNDFCGRTSIPSVLGSIMRLPGWMPRTPDRAEILHVNFEELKQKPQEQLGRIVDFLRHARGESSHSGGD